MMTADTDYARVVALLTKQQLAPYVSYAKSDDIHGLAKNADGGRVVVRVSDGKIISGDSSGIEAGDYHNRANPVSHPSFDPACYRAVAEVESTYNDVEAVRFDLKPVCKNEKGDDNDYPFTTLYASARTLQPLDVSGSTSDSHVHIALDQAYGLFDGRILPAQLKVDVDGAGLMFWLHMHVVEHYSDYRFTTSP